TVLVVVAGMDVLVVVAGSAAVQSGSPALLPLQMSLYPVPPAISLWTQPANCVHSRVSSPPFTIASTTYTLPVGALEMFNGTSPRLLPTTFTSDDLMTLTFTAPPAGAVLLTYLPTVAELTSQLLPCAITNDPLASS